MPTHPLIPLELGPAPFPMTAIVRGAFKGKALLVFFNSTIDAAPDSRMKLDRR